MTGQPLSFLIEVERRSMIAGSDAARDLSGTLRIASLAAVAGALAIVLLLYRAVTRPVLARIEAVRRAASAVGRGELDTRLSVATRDELGLLVANFNRMAARLARREGRLAADRAALEDTVAARTLDLRAANARLEAVDRSRRRFFADVSHELRTPLTVILGECDIAARSAGRAGSTSRPVFATIRKRALRLQRRVEDLLRVARSESGQIELDRRPVSAAPILADAVDGMASEAARRRVALEPRAGRRRPDAARRPGMAAPGGREPDRQRPAPRHRPHPGRASPWRGRRRGPASVTVTDDGPGFPDARRGPVRALPPREPLGRGRASASAWPWRAGSWSAMMASSASARARRPRCAGRPRTAGAGLARSRRRRDSIGTTRRAEGDRGMTRVLIVEDDSDIRAMLARGLEAEGFSVGVAGCVDDALAAARAEAPEAVVLDITLPDGSGHDVCRSLREGGYPGPILFLSARDEVRDRAEGLALGADDYIVKPFVFDELLARLQTHLLRRKAADAAPHHRHRRRWCST